MQNIFKEFIKYSIVGIIGALVDWLLFFLLRDLLFVNYLVAHIVSSSIAIINNFLLNYLFTFKVRNNILKRGISFFSIGLFGLFISSLLLPFGVHFIERYGHDIFDVSNKKLIQTISKIFATLFVACIQFILNRYISFNQYKQQ